MFSTFENIILIKILTYCCFKSL